jgi:energy-coupling factor transport system ATP-binding protein
MINHLTHIAQHDSSICFDHLTYTYPGSPDPALRDVTLDVQEGEFVLVTGASGSGKSTLLRCLNGLVPHFTGGTVGGEVSVADHNPIDEGPHTLSRVVGFVFQDPEAQFVVDRVEDEIAFALENAAVPPTEMRLRVEEALHLLDLAPLRNRRLDTLSGGEKQKVAIAAALALRPRILALDEPTSQLDPQSAEDVLQALVRLNQDLGLTIVLAEHRLERVLPYVDRLIFLSNPDHRVLSGPVRHILGKIDLAPPLVALGKALEWDPLPLTVKEGRRFAAQTQVPDLRSRPSSLSGDKTAPRGFGNPLFCPGSGDAGRAESEPLSPESRAPDREAQIEIQNLHFAYNGKSILKGVDLQIAPGELLALMGRNGSGKTTLLKCVVGLLHPDRGEIKMRGESLIGQKTADICQDVGYLPQEPDDLLFADTVGDELDITLRNHNLLDRPPIAPDDLLARLALEDVKARYPRDLSAGQRQRVALGAVTITRPGLLLLDEPTRGLDYQAKRDLVHLLREWQAQGASILLVTHDVELVAQAADRVVLLSKGKVIADDVPGLLSASPLFAPQVARLFPGTGWLTVDEALEGLSRGAGSRN